MAASINNNNNNAAYAASNYKKTNQRRPQQLNPRQAVFEKCDTFKFNPSTGVWEAISVNNSDTADDNNNNNNQQQQQSVNSLTVVTYNVLFDAYVPELIYTANRIPFILSLLEQTDADIIGLEEVTHQFLVPLLEAQWVRNRYYVSDSTSAGGKTVDPYGQVLLSKFPFTTSLHVFSSHKRLIVGEMQLNCRRVFIPVVHLTSDHNNTESAADKRAHQLNVVYHRTDHENSDCILIGDFNFGDYGWPRDTIRSDFRDAWLMLRPAEHGYTYNPKVNNTAAITSVTGQVGRFDRVLVRSPHWKPASIEIFGTEPIRYADCDCAGDDDQRALINKMNVYPSDHFAVKAVLEFVENYSEAYQGPESRDFLYQYIKNRFDDVFETPEGQVLRDRVRADLRRLLEACFNDSYLNNNNGQVEWNLFIFGSSKLGIQSPSSDIDAICVSRVSRRDFFTALFRFLTSKPKNFAISAVRAITNAHVPMVKFKLSGVQIDLQYVCVFDVPASAAHVLKMDENDLRKMDEKSLRSLNGVIDTEQLLQVITPNLTNFNILLSFVKLWAKRRGLYSNRFGYLGGYGYSILVGYVCQVAPKDESTLELLARFFDTYSKWDWRSNAVSLALTPPITYRIEPKDLMPIITTCKPYKNSARSVTYSTLRLMQDELDRAAKITNGLHHSSGVNNNNNSHNNNNNNDNDNNDSSLSTTIDDKLNELLQETDFFSRYDSYLVLTASALTKAEFEDWTGYIESRIPDVLAKCEKNRFLLQPFHGRLVNPNSQNFPYSCLYVIGIIIIIKNNNNAISADDDDDDDTGIVNVNYLLQPFFNDATFIHWPQRTAGMDLIVKLLDRSSMPRIPSLDIHEADEEEEAKEKQQTEDDDDDNNNNSNSNNVNDEYGDDTASVVSTAATAATTATATSTSASSEVLLLEGRKNMLREAERADGEKQRMRTADEVYHRIKWDASLHHGQDFTIGALDRFKGVIECPFREFDLETIPFHRIRWFKQGGVVVWDREQRVDLLFTYRSKKEHQKQHERYMQQKQQQKQKQQERLKQQQQQQRQRQISVKG